jgi:hypothetical protein
LNKAARNGIVVLLVIPTIYLLALFGVLPSYTLMPVVFGGFVFIIVMIALVVAQMEIFSSFMSRSKIFKKYSDPDPTVYRRAVKDGVDGVEYIVNGSETTSFREACMDNWHFLYVDRKSSWLIKDDRGNDITESPLSTYDGIAVLIGDYGTKSQRDSTDRRAEFSDLKDTVEYYD